MPYLPYRVLDIRDDWREHDAENLNIVSCVARLVEDHKSTSHK